MVQGEKHFCLHSILKRNRLKILTKEQICRRPAPARLSSGGTARGESQLCHTPAPALGGSCNTSRIKIPLCRIAYVYSRLAVPWWGLRYFELGEKAICRRQLLPKICNKLVFSTTFLSWSIHDWWRWPFTWNLNKMQTAASKTTSCFCSCWSVWLVFVWSILILPHPILVCLVGYSMS